MGWYSDAVNFLTEDGGKMESILNSDLVGGVVQGAVGKGLSGYFQPDVPKVGYQGKIPELQAVRERVPMQQPDEGEAPRRPGSAGRRYFSDTQFAGRPSPSAPSVSQAQSTAKAQAQQLAEQNQAKGMASGGIASAYNRRHNGYYLGGKTDGMADEVPANIDGNQEALLSDG